MTVPIIPGPFAGLGAGLTQGIASYNAEKQKQYEEALKGSQFIYNLIQTGQLDPSVLQQPNVMQGLKTAKLPQPAGENIVPSVPAMVARATQRDVAAAAPGSAAESVALGRPGQSAVTGEQVQQEINKFRLDRANPEKYPALMRHLAGTPDEQILRGLELGKLSSIDRQAYTEGARDYVSQAWTTTGGNVKSWKDLAENAYNLAKSDPQYAELIANGQMSQEYFSAAAQELFFMDDKRRQGWQDIWARQARDRSELRQYYNNVLQGYDRNILELQSQVKANELTMTQSMGLLNPILEKDQKGLPLSPDEQLLLQKYQDGQSVKEQLRQTMETRQNYHDQFLLQATPPGTAEQRATGRATIVGGAGTVTRGGGAATPAPKGGVVPRRAAPATPAGVIPAAPGRQAAPIKTIAPPAAPKQDWEYARDLFLSNQTSEAEVLADQSFGDDEKTKILGKTVKNGKIVRNP